MGPSHTGLAWNTQLAAWANQADPGGSRISLQICACWEGPRRCPPSAVARDAHLPLSPSHLVPGQGRISAAPTTDRHTPLPQHSQDRRLLGDRGTHSTHPQQKSLQKLRLSQDTKLLHTDKSKLEGATGQSQVTIFFRMEGKKPHYIASWSRSFKVNLSSGRQLKYSLSDFLPLLPPLSLSPFIKMSTLPPGGCFLRI